MRAVLLAGQVAMTLVLVIGAALFVRSLRAAVTTDVGVDVDRIFYASVNFSTSRYELHLHAAAGRASGRRRQRRQVPRVP